jgi:ABC-type transporter Mla MlaB component
MPSSMAKVMVISFHRIAIAVDGCSVCLGHIDSGTPALLLHMSRDAEAAGSADV